MTDRTAASPRPRRARLRRGALPALALAAVLATGAPAAAQTATTQPPAPPGTDAQPPGSASGGPTTTFDTGTTLPPATNPPVTNPPGTPPSLPPGTPPSVPPTTVPPGPPVGVAVPKVTGPLPGTVPGDRLATDIAKTYPFFSTPDDLARVGYVEEEYKVSGTATAHSATGAVLAENVPYTTRVIVRRPTQRRRFNGSVLVEWQNVTAGYDLDALWNYKAATRDGYAWVGVSAQRVGVQQLAGWSPARYGDLDVTGGGRFTADELSYDIYQQAAQALADARRPNPMGGLRVRHLLSVGASQSAGRMTVYYNTVLPRYRPVFDGYAFIVGSAPSRVGPERIMHVLSETDVRTADRMPDTDHYRRWEVAGGAHSGWNGQEYRAPITARDLPTGTPQYNCDQPPFSRVPMQHVTAVAYNHLVRWIERGTLPPLSPKFEFNADGTKARTPDGLAKGGIRLSQVDVPTALNTGDNSGESFCRLFGTYRPYSGDQLRALYRDHHDYVDRVTKVDERNVRAGFLRPADAFANFVEAAHADVPPKVTAPVTTVPATTVPATTP